MSKSSIESTFSYVAVLGVGETIGVFALKFAEGIILDCDLEGLLASCVSSKLGTGVVIFKGTTVAKNVSRERILLESEKN